MAPKLLGSLFNGNPIYLLLETDYLRFRIYLTILWQKRDKEQV